MCLPLSYSFTSEVLVAVFSCASNALSVAPTGNGVPPGREREVTERSPRRQETAHDTGRLRIERFVSAYCSRLARSRKEVLAGQTIESPPMEMDPFRIHYSLYYDYSQE